MEIIRHENKCTVKSTRNNTLVEAEIMDFDYKKKMTVVVGKAVKISMTWNGSFYEGKGAGMDFESAGPKVSKTKTGR